VEAVDMQLLTVGDVARELDVAAETIRLWERLGKLHAERTASGIRLFRRDDVERFAKERLARLRTA
jgi:DNA-binding transcriptional MerR regulator